MKLWIARDRDNTLCVYNNKPILSKEVEGLWVCDKSTTVNTLSEDYFPEVTFENSPQEIELKLINENVGVAESPLKTFPRVNEFESGASYRR